MFTALIRQSYAGLQLLKNAHFTCVSPSQSYKFIEILLQNHNLFVVVIVLFVFFCGGGDEGLRSDTCISACLNVIDLTTGTICQNGAIKCIYFPTQIGSLRLGLSTFAIVC